MNNPTFQTRTKTTAANAVIAVYSYGLINGFSVLNYNLNTNLNYNSDGIQYVLNAGTVVFGSGGVISSFSPKKVFTI